jgi:uncharacterized metal-binding protein
MEVIFMNSEDKKIAIVACSGAANTGQTSNEVATNLCAKSEDYTMVCLAALTLGHKNSLDKIADARKIVVIDGCPVKCASQIVAKYTDKKPDLDIQIMEEYEIKKVSKPSFEKEDVDKIVKDIEKKIKKL